MSLKVGYISEIEFLPSPCGVVREFVWELACNSGGCLIEYIKLELLCTAESFCRRRNLDPDEKKEVLEWVNGLPWDEDGRIILYFSW